ncbi:type IV pilus assembly protein FimV [Undibacterium sp. SXout7W]|uniref:type IV pilus assembly protein FimV n=1 Tax=Undibacterium sp. SXout7W TaxID=3413049 RepID=UPI003BF09686
MKLIWAGAVASVAAGNACALSLGNVQLQSGLGQQLKAQIEINGIDTPTVEQECFKARVESAEGDLLAPVVVSLSAISPRRVLTLVTRKNIPEPAAKLVIDVGCEVQLHREYLVLLDPPQFAKLPSAQTKPDLPLVSNTDAKELLPKSNAAPREKIKRSKEKALADTEIVSASAEKKPARTQTTSSAQPVEKSRNTKEVGRRDELKLSDEVAIFPAGLRISDSLSATENTPRSDIADLRAAQAQFAAMLKDEKPEQFSSEKLKADQQRVQSLQQEAAQLKRQSQLDKAALEDLKETSFSRNLVIGLSAFVLLGLLSVALLLMYIGRMHKKFSSSWWEQKELKPEADSKRSIEELVDSVQASYGPTTDGSAMFPSRESEPSKITVPQTSVSLVKSATVDAPLGNMEAPSVFGKGYYAPSLEDTNSSTFNFFTTRAHSVKVEEISDVTQEAEFWMSVNDPDRAIEILEPQAALEYPDSPVPWLYLLDLYRVTGQKEKYDQLRDKFVVFFNANIPEFEVDPATLPSRQLEEFEHLMQKICKMWTTNDILPFLQSLLVDDRDGKRMGFELPVYRDILLLISVANELDRLKAFGNDKPGGWNNIPDAPVISPANNNVKEEPESNIINFETIDFRHEK